MTEPEAGKRLTHKSLQYARSTLAGYYNPDLATNLRLDRIRDLFLIGAYTGLRFSDFSQLRPENITHKGQIFTRKTIETFEKVLSPQPECTGYTGKI